MKKSYCTQNNGKCGTCSLTNYGMDCANNPIKTARPKSDKWSRAMENYNGHKGPATVEHVERNIKAAYPRAYDELTGVQYGKLMSVANTSYHDGRNGTGAELCDGLLIAGKVIIPLEIARRITTKTETVTTYRTANDDGKGNLASRGGDNDYYQLIDGAYHRIEFRGTADQLTRQRIPVYWRDRDSVTVVLYNGKEIDRVNGVA